MHIKGFAGARYKKFSTEEEAKDFAKVGQTVQSNAREPESGTEITGSSTARVTLKTNKSLYVY